jgi:hypothetical protein
MALHVFSSYLADRWQMPASWARRMGMSDIMDEAYYLYYLGNVEEKIKNVIGALING